MIVPVQWLLITHVGRKVYVQRPPQEEGKFIFRGN